MKSIKDFKFKIQFNLEERKNHFNNIMMKCSNKIPVIIEKAPTSKIKEFIKTKFLLPKDMKISVLIRLIRNKLDISYTTAVYLIVASKFVITGCELLSEIYQKYKDKDNFLYIRYVEQLTFG